MLMYGFMVGGSQGTATFATANGQLSLGGTSGFDETLGTASESAERVDAEHYADFTSSDNRAGTVGPIRIVDAPCDSTAWEDIDAAFTDAYNAGENLDPAPTPLGFEMLVHDDTLAAGLTVDDIVAAPVLADGATYVTPDGQPYFPPTVGGQPAVALLRTLRGGGAHVALVGEPGTGKTTLAQVAFGDELVRQQFTGETTVEDVVGRWLPVPGQPGAFEFTDGPLAVAMREGRPYLANELVRAPLETQAVFLSVMDHQRRLLVEANPDSPVVEAADGFVVIVDYNPGSGFGLSEALHSRIACPITVPTDLSVARRRGVPGPLVAAAEALHRENLVAVNEAGHTASQWVPSIRDLLKAQTLADQFGIMFAANALVSFCPDLDRRPAVAAALAAVLPDPVPDSGLVAV